MSSQRGPPRPGDPEGSVREQIVYWLGFFVWWVVMLVLFVVFGAWYHARRAWRWLTRNP